MARDFVSNPDNLWKNKGKGKGILFNVGGQQAKTAFLHGPTVWKSPIVGIEPVTFCSESAALTTAPRDPTQVLYWSAHLWCCERLNSQESNG